MNEERLLRYRQDRVRAEMTARDIDALILSDAINNRYATGTSEQQLLVTENGTELLSDFPFEATLLV